MSDTSKLQDQFNAQRARMKELYLQKEKECSQMKLKMILLKKEIEEKDSQLGKLSNLITDTFILLTNIVYSHRRVQSTEGLGGSKRKFTARDSNIAAIASRNV